MVLLFCFSVRHPHHAGVSAHAHVQRFSEAAGAGEEVDLAPVVQKLRDHAGFIYIIESFCTNLFKIFNADGQFYRSFQV